jgi:hypothetical protein
VAERAYVRGRVAPCLLRRASVARCTTWFTKGFDIEFHAMLTEGGVREMRFERVVVG